MANIGTGRGGKSFQDREKAAKVRGQALDAILLVLTDDPAVEQWSDYKKKIVERLSSSILPRLNEHTGTDGAPMKVIFDNSFIDDETTQPSEGDSTLESEVQND